MSHRTFCDACGQEIHPGNRGIVGRVDGKSEQTFHLCGAGNGADVGCAQHWGKVLPFILAAQIEAGYRSRPS